MHDQLRAGQRHARLPADRVRGPLTLSELAIGLNFGDHGVGRRPGDADRAARRDPAGLPSPPTADCAGRAFDGLPEVELFDVDSAGLGAPAAPRRRARGTPSRTRRRYVDPASGTRPGPVRQRPDRRRRLPGRRVDHGDGPMSAIVRTEGLVKRYDRTLAVAGVDLTVERGRDLRPRRAERRRQDDHPADARDAAPAVGRRRPRSTAGRSPGTPTRSAASSASCRTCSGSTTT